MSAPVKNPEPVDLSRYAPLAILVVTGAIGLIAWDALVSANLAASPASTLQTIARLTLGAFLYRGMLRAGLLAHLNEPFGIPHPSSLNNNGDNP